MHVHVNRSEKERVENCGKKEKQERVEGKRINEGKRKNSKM